MLPLRKRLAGQRLEARRENGVARHHAPDRPVQPPDGAIQLEVESIVARGGEAPGTRCDLAAQRELREALRLVAQEGTGIVMVTHHLADILPEITRVIMMRSGRIAADGAKEDLITAEKLRDLFGVEVTLTQRDGYWHSW